MTYEDFLALGYPLTEAPPKTMRPREEMTHFDACGEEDFRTEEQVRVFFGKQKFGGKSAT